MTTIRTTDDTAPDPAAALALIEQQQAEMGRRIARDIPWILYSWAIAWGVGFALLFLIDGAKPALSIPLPVAATAFAALTVAAIVASGIIGGRAQRGIRSSPAAAFTGTVFGITCSASFVALVVFGQALVANGMPADLLNVYYPVAAGLLVGIIYLMAGAIWQGVPMVVLGGWIMLVSLVAPWFGYPGHYLVFAIAGGGGFLVGAIALSLSFRTRKAAA